MEAFEKGIIGNVEIKNRFVMAPMISNLCNPDGTTNDNHIRYLEERARGGFGLIITEYAYVDEYNGKGSPNEMGIFSREQLPKLSRLTERIHSAGSKIFVQLVHAGGKANPRFNSGNIFAPSSVDYIGIVPNEMGKDDIKRVEDRFVNAAELAYRSGFDGIELHGAHGYLLQEFISPALNKRNDEYGGTVENRIRIINEISEKIRTRIDLPVGIRLSLYEDDVDGYSADYGIEIASKLKNIDYIHFSAGRFAPPGSSASFYYENVHIGSKLRKKLDKTTMLVGSIESINDVEKALKISDFVVLGRQALADPYTPLKMRINIPYRPCIRCNQACRNLSNAEVRCTINPDTGLENTVSRKIKYTGEIAIVGSGIKGLEAALYSASLGLKPIIYETNRFGGQFNEIVDKYKKHDFMQLIEYYRSMIGHYGIDIRMESVNKGIFCLPDKVYPDLPENRDITIDTNIYRYFDDALKIAGKNKVTMSLRSLNSLERSRITGYKKLAESSGIIFKDMDSYDFKLLDSRQYDIMEAMKSGRRAINNYLIENETNFL
ncbi:NADH:flavin oxidoreductase [Ferroplasma sp.]|uniref:oxidoreductase n=1 Tax=Ferroplasma sp. TaxID=2591003 RepID=UPI00307D03C8